MTRFILIFIVTFGLLSTGCPKAPQSIRDFKEKSAQLSVYGEHLIKAFGDAEVAGEITKEQLGTLNKATGAYVKAVGVYRAAIAEAEQVLASGKTLPAGTITHLTSILNDQVVAAFFDILTSLHFMTESQAQLFETFISGLRLTILALQGAFSELTTQEGYNGLVTGYSIR